ncbi:MAB_1171c family putative transporter [Actinoplanes sp. NPDC051851]|uniref:MAB_1171c family putative transporter n=1 Tax=Actinoplanes sp. NPDC051851 TaxID=3154753 RepID=UPI00342FA78D
MIITGTILGALWVVILARLPTLRGDRRQRVLWVNLLACALAVTLALPALIAGADVPVAAHLCGVVAAHTLLRFISLVTATGRTGLQYLTVIAVLTFMITVSAVAGVHSSPRAQTDGIPPAEVAYWTVFEGYLAVALAVGGLACGRIARAAPSGALRGGLLAMASGSLLIFTYAVSKAVLVILRGSGTPLDFTVWEPVITVLRTTGLALYVAGGAVPAASRVREVLAAYRSLLALRPLWGAMRRAFPDMVLMPPARAALELPGAAGARLRLYRRVIEIRDGMLALREHLPAAPGPAHPDPSQHGAPQPGAPRPDVPQPGTPQPDVPQPGVGWPGTPQPEVGRPAGSCPAVHPGEDPAVAEARGIAAALRRRAAGEAPADPAGRWAPVGPDMADEVAWLTRVSAAYRRLG